MRLLPSRTALAPCSARWSGVLVLATSLAGCGAARATNTPIDDVGAGTASVVRLDNVQGANPTSSTTELRLSATPIGATENELPASADRAWGVLPQTLEKLGIPVNTILSDARILGAKEARMSRRLGRTPLSRYLDCGRDVTGVAFADSYELRVTALARIVPGPGADRATIVTQVAATGRPITVSGNTVQCTSTGALEALINHTALEQLSSK